MKATTVDEYIGGFPDVQAAKLQELREVLKGVAPGATEGLKWGKPVMEEGRILYSYSGYKTHINFMPTRTSLEPFRDALKDYTTGMDTIQFPYDKPLPVDLIRQIATYRRKDVVENGALWMG